MTDTRKPAADAAAPGERPGRDLQRINDQLRDLVASLRNERERLAAEGRSVAAGSSATAATCGEEPIDLEKKRLATELALAREAVAHAHEERERLRTRLMEIEAQNQRICDDFVAAQEKTTDLAQLFVALERIHGGISRAETLAALQEIVINVVGSEELAIFERRGDRLALVQSFGIDPEPLRELPLDHGAIGRAATSGVLYVAERDGAPATGDDHLTACIPLRVGDSVVGVIAVFRLLGHKPGIGAADQAVFELLSSHVGLALHLRELRERALSA